MKIKYFTRSIWYTVFPAITVSASLLLLSGCESSSALQVGDISIDYSTYGEGYPLVMIMGYSGTKDMWDPTVIKSLSSQYKVIIFDNRGMGNTTTGILPFSIEQFADDTAGLMNALEVENAYVLGWSMGTEIAQSLALRHPEKVSKLVLYAADCQLNLFPPSPEILREVTERDSSSEEANMDLLKLLIPEHWFNSPANIEYISDVFSGVSETSSPESVAGQESAMENWAGCCDRLLQITCPTLIITGAEDVLTPPKNSSFLAERIPRAELVIIAGGGHGVMYQYPSTFATSVLDFLAR